MDRGVANLSAVLLLAIRGGSGWFWGAAGWILAPQRGAFGVPFGAKMDEIRMLFGVWVPGGSPGVDFGSILDRFGVDFGLLSRLMVKTSVIAVYM